MLFVFCLVYFPKIFLISKLFFGFYLFMLLRGTLPRYRIDVLILLNWKVIVPIFTLYLFIAIIVL